MKHKPLSWCSLTTGNEPKVETSICLHNLIQSPEKTVTLSQCAKIQISNEKKKCCQLLVSISKSRGENITSL